MTVVAIARNTFREAIRDRILYGMVAFALLLVVASVYLADLAIGQQARILNDLGLAAISLIGVLIAVFLGVSLVSKEVERRTIYVILSKPVERYEFVLGKFAGLGATLAVNVAVMGAGLLAITWICGFGQPALVAALYLILLETLLLTAVATLFSTFTSSPSLAVVFTLGVFVVGHLSESLRAITSRSESATARVLGELLYRVIPNLEAFNVKGRVAVGEPVGASEIALATLYGLCYMAAVLAVAAAVFSRRDLK